MLGKQKNAKRLSFDEGPASEKKVDWYVSTPSAPLGWINWYAPWRRYVFRPWAETLFDAECLEEIAVFCCNETAARKRERVAKKLLGLK